MDAFLHDLRYAVRHVRRAPGFATAAILTLALGIGANTAMFTALNALLLQPLRVKDPQGLIAITSRNQQDQLRQTLIPIVGELAREGPIELPCALNGNGVFAADVGGVPTQSVIALITGGCFQTFGVAPLLGRYITDADAPLSGPGSHVAVIGYRFWSRMFGQDPHAIGKTLSMEGVEVTVIGVMPEGFSGIQADFGIDVWLPYYSVTPRRADRPSAATQILGRLRPGVSLEQARAELSARWPALMQSIVPTTLASLERDTFTNPRVRVERIPTGTSYYRDRFARPVTIVLALTVALLLLACINLGGLLLSRLSARGPELGIRLALGGSRGRIAQQMLIESLLLSTSGAALAVPVAFGLVRVLESFLPPGAVDSAVRFRPDGSVLAATAAAGVVAGVLMSSVPIWLAWRRRGAMFAWDRTVTGHTTGWTRGLLVAQIALSIVILGGAGMLGRSLYLLQHASLGLQVDRLLNVRVMPLPDGYRGMDASSYYREMHDRLTAIPNVRSVGFARVFPRGISDFVGQPIGLAGQPYGDVRAQLESASPGFFETVGIPLLRGRYPSWADHDTSAPVALVSDSLARKLAPNGDAIGLRVRFGANRGDQDVEIVGVVGNASLGNPRAVDLPVFYRPMLQAGGFAYYPNLVIATHGDPLSVSTAAQAAIKEGGREYATSARTVERIFKDAPSGERMTVTVSAAIAVLSVTLAFIGIYSLLAFSVSRRTREIGVRVALGADRRRVLGMVMREGFTLTLVGMAIGLPSAIFAGRVLRSLMFGISETDPLVLGATTIFFVVLGTAAGLVPAFRAAGVDPAIALRTD